MARPRAKIDKGVFENLCSLQCTLEEIACWFKCSTDTYHRSFADVFAEYRAAGKISLRRKQWKLADKSASMAIFLGKQYLGQKDDVRLGVTAEQGVQIYIPDNGRPDAE